MGFARLAEDMIRTARGKQHGESLSAFDKIFSSAIGEFNQDVFSISCSSPRLQVVLLLLGINRLKSSVLRY